MSTTIYNLKTGKDITYVTSNKIEALINAHLSLNGMDWCADDLEIRKDVRGKIQTGQYSYFIDELSTPFSEPSQCIGDL